MAARLRIGLVVAAALVGLVSAALVASRVELPPPTGASLVGTFDTVLPNMRAITVWYPARAASGRRRAAYRPDGVARGVRERLIFPLVRSAAYADAEVAVGPHPVVLYAPGWGERRTDNTALCEDLASHGFVVVAADDVRPAPPMDFSSADAYRRTLAWANVKVGLQAKAMSAVLDALGRVTPDAAAYRVTRTLDLSRVAAVGYSFGGAAAAELAIVNRRVRAAVNLDGWIFGAAARDGVDKPFMIVGTGAAVVDTPPDRQPAEIELGRYEGELDRMNAGQIESGFRRHGGYYVTIDGTRHESFTDAAVLPLRLRSIPGAIDGRRAQRIVAAYVYDFLMLAVNGRAAPLLAPAPGSATATARSALDRAATVTIWTPPAAQRISG